MRTTRVSVKTIKFCDVFCAYRRFIKNFTFCCTETCKKSGATPVILEELFPHYIQEAISNDRRSHRIHDTRQSTGHYQHAPRRNKHISNTSPRTPSHSFRRNCNPCSLPPPKPTYQISALTAGSPIRYDIALIWIWSFSLKTYPNKSQPPMPIPSARGRSLTEHYLQHTVM